MLSGHRSGLERLLAKVFPPAALGSRARTDAHLPSGTSQRTVTLPSLVKRIYSEFSEDRVLAVAGGITFFFFLAIFPAIACVVALYGFFDDRRALQEGLQLISGFIPGGAVSVLTAEVQRLVSQQPTALNATFLIGFLVAVWSASGGVKAIIDGLNIAFEVAETRSFLKLTLSALALTLGMLAATAATIYFSIIFNRYIAAQSNHALKSAFEIAVWPVAFCLCSIIVSLIYRYGPNRVRTPWRWITWGSGFASTFWLLGTWLFSWYAEHYGSYNRTYGVFGGLAGFLTWVWLSVVVLLTGAEIICELERKDFLRRGPQASSQRKASRCPPDLPASQREPPPR
jgi:membrane protein